MKDLFKPVVIKNFIIVLAILLGMKVVWFTISLVWLSTIDLDQSKQERSKALYYRVKLSPNDAPAPIQKRPKQIVHANAGSIKDIKLLAIYNASDITVVTVEYKSKTKVLSNGDVINGFSLESAGNDYAIFSKSSKDYKVMLIKNAQVLASHSIVKSRPKNMINHTPAKKKLGKVTDAGDHKVIDRSLLEHYASNIDDIYKNIGIGEVKKGKDVVGFRINFVKRDSPFAQLGIRRDDVIKSINGQVIDSYSAAFGVYKNIKDIDNMSLVIERGKEEMELEYEIN
jgi:general secretion pathway protein C